MCHLDSVTSSLKWVFNELTPPTGSNRTEVGQCSAHSSEEDRAGVAQRPRRTIPLAFTLLAASSAQPAASHTFLRSCRGPAAQGPRGRDGFLLGFTTHIHTWQAHPTPCPQKFRFSTSRLRGRSPLWAMEEEGVCVCGPGSPPPCLRNLSTRASSRVHQCF